MPHVRWSRSLHSFARFLRRPQRGFTPTRIRLQQLEDRLAFTADTWRAGLSPDDLFVLTPEGSSEPLFSLSAQGDVSITPSGSNLFALDASGNITLAGMLTTGSSRTLKENLVAVDGSQTLSQIAALPIYRWNYLTDPAGVKHLGPIAEDFYAQFQLGADPQHLAPTDLSSVALPALQELVEIVNRQQAQLAWLLDRFDELGPELFSSAFVQPGQPVTNVIDPALAAQGIRVLALDQVIADDLIVVGSTAIGSGATDGEDFGLDTLRLKDPNIRIHFEDTSLSENFPGNDWRILINDTTPGGASHFSIEDSTGNTIPFQIVAGASANSAVVNSFGNLGLGILNPVADIHLVTGDSPSVRLEQDNSAGWTPQAWDFGGNQDQFFIRDLTNGSLVPFAIQPGASSNSLTVGFAGNIGIGTNNADSSLHVGRYGSSAPDVQLLVQDLSPQAATRDQVNLRNNGAGSVVLTNSVTNATWRLGMGATNQFQILSADVANPGVQIATDGSVMLGANPGTFSLDAGGNLTLSGTLSQSSSRTVKENFSAVDARQVLSALEELPLYRWNYLTDSPSLQHLGPMAEDFFETYSLGADAQHLAPSDVAGVALAGIQALSEQLRQQSLLIQALTSIEIAQTPAVDLGRAVVSTEHVPWRFLALDQVVEDDLIVRISGTTGGSMAVGLDAVDDENFGFDTLRLKEGNLRIHFDDTSTSPGDPSNDWRILVNDITNGGSNHFSIEDSTGNTVPFRVDAGAKNFALVVASDGKLGLGTDSPAVAIHAVDGNTPTIRLEQDNTDGLIPQTWDVVGNEAHFFVRDASNDDKLPFRIRPGAPTNSLNIAASGNVGLGTSDPTSSLHVLRSDGTAQVQVQQNSTIAPRDLLALQNHGAPLLAWTNTASGTDVTWKAGMTAAGDFAFDFADTAGTEFKIGADGTWTMGTNGASNFVLDTQGNLTLAGTLTQGSSWTLKDNFETLDSFDILRRLETLPVFTWNYTAESDSVVHMSPMAEDFYALFGLGTDAQHLAVSDLAGANLAALQALQAIAWYQGEQIEMLSARLGDQSWTSDLPEPGVSVNPAEILAFANFTPETSPITGPLTITGQTPRAEAGLGVEDQAGHSSTHVAGTWRDQDPTTPDVVDIWYDFRNEGAFSNLITSAQIASTELVLQGWETASGGLVHFSRNVQAGRADIINIGVGDMAAFGMTSAYGGTLGIGGATVMPGADPYLSYGIAWLDAAETWDTDLNNGNPAGSFDFFTVLAHEVGHALGMNHVHDSSELDVLSEFYQGEVPFLTAENVHDIQNLYGGASTGEGPGSRVQVLSQDQVVNENLIVIGNVAIGTDALEGEDFGLDTLRFSENNLRIHFDDTSGSASFPTNDWRIVINDTTNNGANHFSIEDATAGRIPFRVMAGAPTSSFLVDANGYVGLGTSAPQQKLHVLSGNQPTIRLEQDDSSGWTPQTFDVGGNESTFFIRDVTNGSSLPFQIRSAAPTNSLHIASSGNVGVGTDSPTSTLHIQRSDGTAQLKVEELSSTTAARDLLVLANNGAPSIVFTNTQVPSWHNVALPEDVDGDEDVDVVDAVILINNLLTHGPRVLPVPAPGTAPFLDVDGDLDIDVVDAVIVINYLLNRAQPSQPVSSLPPSVQMPSVMEGESPAKVAPIDDVYESADLDWDLLAIGTAFQAESDKGHERFSEGQAEVEEWGLESMPSASPTRPTS